MYLVSQVRLWANLSRPSQVRAAPPRARGWDADLRTASNQPDQSLAVFVMKANLKVKCQAPITPKVNGGGCRSEALPAPARCPRGQINHYIAGRLVSRPAEPIRRGDKSWFHRGGEEITVLFGDVRVSEHSRTKGSKQILKVFVNQNRCGRRCPPALTLQDAEAGGERPRPFNVDTH